MARIKNRKYAKEFARRMNARMEELQMTGYRLSILTGITQGQINKYVHGTSIPRVDNAVKLAFGLAMPVADLIDFTVD